MIHELYVGPWSQPGPLSLRLVRLCTSSLRDSSTRHEEGNAASVPCGYPDTLFHNFLLFALPPSLDLTMGISRLPFQDR